MSHFRPGPYVLLDNLDESNRFIINSFLSYAPGDRVDDNTTFWLKYLFIHCCGESLCFNLWNLDIISNQKNMSKLVEWDSGNTEHSFVTVLKQKELTLNGKRDSLYNHMPKINNSKKVRDKLFSTGEVKILDTIIKNKRFTLEYRLVCDPQAPLDDRVWDRSDSVNIRHRINIEIEMNNGHGVTLLLDKGTRGFPSIKTNNWYPTREMDGALISKDKALSVPKLTYIKSLK